ncbi:unnamed protein product [Schistosoma margrebowiei]|uniref:Uncharacterized protein n=1 Tax=Schistosoma margrebowiei TaxID=48269 RepID=A0A3P8BHZ6_9TREM|nr:unnamed protein product [Schistosoma margrebowiei]
MLFTGPEISKGLEQWNTDLGKNAILQYGFELISNTVKAELVPQLLLDSIKEIYQDINSNLSNLDAIAFKEVIAEESKSGTTQRITPKVIMSELNKVIQPEEFSQTSDLYQSIVQKFDEKLNNREKIWCTISADRAVKNALAFDILESILLGLIKFTVPRIIDKVARKKPGDVLISMAVDSLLSLSIPGPITGTYTNNPIEEKLLKKGLEMLKYHIDNDLEDIDLIETHQETKPGKCQSHSDDYCESHIRNSICNRIKNECFCRLGFVAIRENNEIVCRPLLTDLPCRVDSDCVHVDLSVCHPGAGRCICPGNTVYVTHLHACRTKLFHQNYDACKMCDTDHVCHEIMSKDLDRVKDLNVIIIKLDGTLNSSNEPAFIGCTCEFNPISTPTIIPTGSQIPGKNHLCPVNLPDIGEACDHSYLACRSRSAQCVSGDLPNMKVCTCPENTVAVYQTFLNYFECFPVVNKSISHLTNTKSVVSDDCQPCQKINGTCYDLNNDGIPDGCRCPPGRSFIHKGDRHENSRNLADSMNLIQYKDKLKFPCELKHTETKCDEQKLTVCYLPHSSGRFQTLPYYLQLNMVDVSLVQSMYRESFDRGQSCSLSSQLNRISNTLNAKKIYPPKDKWYCITLFNDQLLMSTCRVKLNVDSTCNELTNTQNLQYSGSVYIRQKNQIYPDDKAILEIPWKCTVKRICNLKPKPINKITNQQVENNLGQLYVMNKNNEITTETGEGESVYLELISKYEKFVISTKMCAVASLKFPESFNSESVIDIHLCQAFYQFKYYGTVNSYHNQTIFISDIPTRIQNNNTSFYRQSEIFRADRLIPQQNTVYYLCHVPPLNASMKYRVDSSTIQDWCGISNKRIKLSPADHLFITKLTIRNSNSSHHSKLLYFRLCYIRLNSIYFS